MSGLHPRRSEITTARNFARLELDRALVALAGCAERADLPVDATRETLLNDVAAKLQDLLEQEERLAEWEGAALTLTDDDEPTLLRFARKRWPLRRRGAPPRI